MHVDDRQRAVIEALGLSAEDLRGLAEGLERNEQVVCLRSIAQAEIDARPTHHRYVKPLHRLIAWAGDDNAANVDAQDVARWARRAGDEARADARSRHGVGAEEAMIQASRAAYARAIRSGLLRVNPAAEVRLPDRPPSGRLALTSEQLRQTNLSLIAHSRDPELDDVVFHFLRETACRRSGAAGLSRGDLEERVQVVRLVEKYGKQRWIPVSAHLLARLTGRHQPHEGCDRVLHRADGGHLSAKWFEGFGRRIQQLGWAAALGVSAHWIRHTTLTDIERIAGIRVSAGYAGHSDHAFGVTGLYTKPSLEELRLAHSQLFFDDPTHASDPSARPLLFRRPLPVSPGTINFTS